jgi:hypothetical protein
MSKIEVNAIEPQCGTTLTLGASGDTVSIASGANLSGVGTVSWDTTAKTAAFTAVSGNGYFINTTSGAITVTLPASPSSGDIIAIADYANTWQTNNVTVARNGSLINGNAFDYIGNTEGISLTFVYVDGTRGWKNVNDGTTDATGVNPFIVATGGTVTCCGDYKIHTFTSPGTFTVTNAGTPAGSTTVDYLVVAGGGGSASSLGFGVAGSAGGGAGGFRLSNSTCMPAPLTSPLASPTGLPVSVTGYPITVGAGGAGSTNPGACGSNPGSNSVFSTITSAGGGGGSGGCIAAGNGGSGGGGGFSPGVPTTSGGSGNTPPVSPPQGNNGGNGAAAPPYSMGGGGGAGAAGTSSSGGNSGAGGIGSYVVSAGFAGCNGTTGPVGSTRYFAGGGGPGSGPQSPGSGLAGGAGGGGTGGNPTPPGVGQNGTTNTGGGAGGAGNFPGPGPSTTVGSAGGSGIVIIRYKYQ